MVRQPRAGAVKTRLGRGIGMTGAAWWYRHQCTRLLRRLGRDRRWRTVLAVAPDTALGARDWPATLPRIAQGSGDIGARMLRTLGAAGPGPAVLIGSDIPGVRPVHIADAFTRLGGHDAVFGPATDGGFWLIGLPRPAAPPPGLFADVRWSGPDALADTLAGLPGARIGFAATLADVDEAVDLPAGQ